MTDADKSGWFVAQLRPHGLMQARRNLHRQGFETFSPELLDRQKRAGNALQVRRPLFPGYIFVSFDPKSSGWTAINNTWGISRLILHDPRHPRALPASLMAGLRARCDENDIVTGIIDVEVGDQIRVLSGPFAELVTSIDTLPDHERVGVLVELMGRKVRTSLPRSQIIKVS